MTMIDYSAMKFPKTPPDRDAEYLRFVRGHTCAALSNQCHGVTECAHIETYGRSKKASDFFVVPLCTKHHRDQHSVGILTFQMNEGVDLWESAARMLAAWIRRGCR